MSLVHFNDQIKLSFVLYSNYFLKFLRIHVHTCWVNTALHIKLFWYCKIPRLEYKIPNNSQIQTLVLLFYYYKLIILSITYKHWKSCVFVLHNGFVIPYFYKYYYSIFQLLSINAKLFQRYPKEIMDGIKTKKCHWSFLLWPLCNCQQVQKR